MKKNKPLVTVAIPVYCGEKYISRAIKSVLNQTFSDFELLIIDNNSNDQTERIVNSFNDKRIVFIRNKKNIGFECNWNKCLKISRGKYIKILPHDDYLDLNCLRVQVDVMEKDLLKDISLCFSSRYIVNQNEKVIFKKNYPFRKKGGSISGENIKKMSIFFGTNLIGEPAGVLFRRETSKKVGKFSAKFPYVIDLDYWFRLLNFGNAFYINIPLAFFRISPYSTSVSLQKKQQNDFENFALLAIHDLNLPYAKIYYSVSKMTSFFNKHVRFLFYKFLN
jgi:glycosyltransferase involved in cell wall biosynthesis